MSTTFICNAGSAVVALARVGMGAKAVKFWSALLTAAIVGGMVAASDTPSIVHAVVVLVSTAPALTLTVVKGGKLHPALMLVVASVALARIGLKVGRLQSWVTVSGSALAEAIIGVNVGTTQAAAVVSETAVALAEIEDIIRVTPGAGT
jgi:hypothetical protein